MSQECVALLEELYEARGAEFELRVPRWADGAADADDEEIVREASELERQLRSVPGVVGVSASVRAGVVLVEASHIFDGMEAELRSRVEAVAGAVEADDFEGDVRASQLVMLASQAGDNDVEEFSDDDERGRPGQHVNYEPLRPSPSAAPPRPSPSAAAAPPPTTPQRFSDRLVLPGEPHTGERRHAAGRRRRRRLVVVERARRTSRLSRADRVAAGRHPLSSRGGTASPPAPDVASPSGQRMLSAEQQEQVERNRRAALARRAQREAERAAAAAAERRVPQCDGATPNDEPPTSSDDEDAPPSTQRQTTGRRRPQTTRPPPPTATRRRRRPGGGGGGGGGGAARRRRRSARRRGS